ncbi:TcmI family type II polyketide cyclase [Solwaraspora sp. WMMD406]|uniref:TcmI family type II polyketide cyclase n=1 Tax=Solwaraspora sp. WMMD406 TaxID=3016095 RepID=UPI0024159F7C|nr:TcmI family type II polyketide cyclase [Solwaraspora sp. WMMD406]MDG4763532.1 TcmI family type II polyketide cyclase [Solwaraspora sp. WMMD406]
MYRSLIVARMLPDVAPQIADIFGRSDQTSNLPQTIGVRARSLFQFGEVYLHLVEGDEPVEAAVTRSRKHPEFRRISDELRPFVSAYDPTTWREPKDAMAREFYRWERDA